MPKEKRRVYVVEWSKPEGRWVFVWWRGKNDKEVICGARSETKAAFVKVARAYMREGSACIKHARQLLIRDLNGRVVDEASYNCDSSAPS